MMQTRTLLASTFLVLLSACSAECSCNGGANDDDGEGGSDTTVTGATTSTQGAGGSDGGGTPTGAGGTGEGGGTGGAGTGGDGTGGGVGGGGTGGGEEAGYCAQGCAEAADCCPEGVEGCPGDYPYNVECTDGICQYGGCASNEDCAAFGEGYGCFDIGGTGVCVEACDVDADCALEAQGFTCTGESNDGTYCTTEVPPCETDEDCFGSGTCQEDGSCSCAGDEECTNEGFVCVE